MTMKTIEALRKKLAAIGATLDDVSSEYTLNCDAIWTTTVGVRQPMRRTKSNGPSESTRLISQVV